MIENQEYELQRILNLIGNTGTDHNMGKAGNTGMGGNNMGMGDNMGDNRIQVLA